MPLCLAFLSVCSSVSSVLQYVVSLFYRCYMLCLDFIIIFSTFYIQSDEKHLVSQIIQQHLVRSYYYIHATATKTYGIRHQLFNCQKRLNFIILIQLLKCLQNNNIREIIMCQATIPGLKLGNSSHYEYQSSGIHSEALPRERGYLKNAIRCLC